MQLGDVVDELHDDHGLANTSTTKRTDLAALEERADEVDDLDAGLEELGGGGLLCQAQEPDGESDSLVGPPGRRSSTGSPVTLNTRPDHASRPPARRWSACVDDIHAALEPSEEDMATARTQLPHRGAAELREPV